MLPILIALIAVAASIVYFIHSWRVEYRKQVASQMAPLPSRTLKNYSLEEVARHNTREDAWLIVKDKDTGEKRVYDVTDYVDMHPGGLSIIKNAGSDATEGFHGPQHPITVFDVITEYHIGCLID